MSPTFDSAWHQRALAGEVGALGQLADACVEPLYRFAFYRVGCDQALAEDVVQETLARALAQLERYEPQRADGSIFGWLTGLARNEIRRLSAERRGLSLDALWARMDGVLLEIYASLETRPLDDEVLQREETQQMVNATMSQLPPRYRQALEAKYLEGLSVRDIAAAFASTEKAIESLLSRARAAFKTTFGALAESLRASAV